MSEFGRCEPSHRDGAAIPRPKWGGVDVGLAGWKRVEFIQKGGSLPDQPVQIQFGPTRGIERFDKNLIGVEKASENTQIWR